VLSDGGYGETQAFHFARAAGRLGVRVVLARRWRPDARGYGWLADSVAGAQPDAVFLSGLLDSNGGQLVEDLRNGLPGATELIGNEGFLPIARLFAASDGAARGMYVSSSALPLEGLPREGRHFASRFAATQAGRPIEPESVYAAQAAEVLLDAIASSDGSRASVVAALRRASVTRGLIGSFRFDRAADMTSAPTTFVRVRRVGGSTTVTSTEGAEVVRVIGRRGRG
jgi:ABC-type branched-subunit amino acid transport system substrate-binding protein